MLHTAPTHAHFRDLCACPFEPGMRNFSASGGLWPTISIMSGTLVMGEQATSKSPSVFMNIVASGALPGFDTALYRARQVRSARSAACSKAACKSAGLLNVDASDMVPSHALGRETNMQYKSDI